MLSHFHALSRCLVGTSVTSIEQKLEQVIELNKSASFFNRWAVARCTGSLGVSATAAREAMHEMVAGVQTACRAAGPIKYERLRRINPFVNHSAAESARTHFYQAGRHVVAAIVALVLGVLSPSIFLIPAMKKVGFEAKVSTTLPGKVKVAVGIGLGVFGLALLTTFVRSRIPKAVVLSVPPAKLSVAAIAGKVLNGTVLILGLNWIAYKIVEKSEYGPFSRVKLNCWHLRAAELPLLNVPVSLVNIVGCFECMTLKFISRKHHFSCFVGCIKNIGLNLVGALPIIGNLAAILYNNQLEYSIDKGREDKSTGTFSRPAGSESPKVSESPEVSEAEYKETSESFIAAFFDSLSLVSRIENGVYRLKDNAEYHWHLLSSSRNDLLLWYRPEPSQANQVSDVYREFVRKNGLIQLNTYHINRLLTRYQGSNEPVVEEFRQFLRAYLPVPENNDRGDSAENNSSLPPTD